MVNVANELIAAVSTGSFFEKIIELDQGEFGEQLPNELISMHNRAQVNLISEFRKLPSFDGNNYSLLYLFGKCLPEIVAPTHVVMDCVLELSAEEGAEMIFSDFTGYCAKEQHRSVEVLKTALAAPKCYRFISCALVAGAKYIEFDFIGKARELLDNSESEVRVQTVIALERVISSDNALCTGKLCKKIEEFILIEKEPAVLACCFELIFTLKFSDKDSKKRLVLFSKILCSGDEVVLHRAALFLSLNVNRLSCELVEIFLTTLKGVPLERKGTIGFIDRALSELVKRKREEHALVFIESYLVTSGASIRLFSAFCRAVTRNSPFVLNKLVTRWLLSENVMLCDATSDILGFDYEHEAILEVYQDELGAKDSVIFLAKRAVGYLFLLPVSGASFLVSLLQYASAENRKIVESLLLDFFVKNYPGKVLNYLEKEPSVEMVLDVVEQGKRYFDELASVPEIKELHPSMGERQAALRKQRVEDAEIRKAADEQSIFRHFCSSVHVLYGNGVVFQRVISESESERATVPFAPINTSVELPQLVSMYPEYIESVLLNLRTEKRDK
ncbi:hypothetical protein [Halodesulfovibrio sp.]|jgi:hypothetical protein|uniref:hypothetical protein n=1 Tax=Halodesulfovibrio sp. TaxID=1912772 RepID=UPI0025DF0A86|nr:hypothetical protein [Halodesulfovibrio sp.]MCT4625677.1 hypothetical protein [Halodesulfovibrio sp.]